MTETATPSPVPAGTLVDDPTIAKLLKEARKSTGGLIGYATRLEKTSQHKEFQLGAILYHLKQDNDYPCAGEKAGWKTFIETRFCLAYERAQNLMNIYEAFTRAGIANPAERYARIGIAKALVIRKELSRVGKGKMTPDELLETAEESTVGALAKKVGKKTRATQDKFTVTVSGDAAKEAEDALAGWGKHFKTDNNGATILSLLRALRDNKAVLTALTGLPVQAPAQVTTVTPGMQARRMNVRASRFGASAQQRAA